MHAVGGQIEILCSGSAASDGKPTMLGTPENIWTGGDFVSTNANCLAYFQAAGAHIHTVLFSADDCAVYNLTWPTTVEEE